MSDKTDIIQRFEFMNAGGNIVEHIWEKKMSKLAVIFPGIGYHTDKPLLYFSKRLAGNAGYEIISVDYSGFPSGVKGSKEKMKESYFIALEQTREMLKKVNFDSYEDVLFISKSVGTAVAAGYAKENNLHVRNIYYTPVEESFQFMEEKSGVVFHGTADPWAETPVIEDGCKRLSLPLYITPDASHSIETGDVQKDLSNFKIIMEQTEAYIKAL